MSETKKQVSDLDRVLPSAITNIAVLREMLEEAQKMNTQLTDMNDALLSKTTKYAKSHIRYVNGLLKCCLRHGVEKMERLEIHTLCSAYQEMKSFRNGILDFEFIHKNDQEALSSHEKSIVQILKNYAFSKEISSSRQSLETVHGVLRFAVFADDMDPDQFVKTINSRYGLIE